MSAPDLASGTADQQLASYVERMHSADARIEHVMAVLPDCVGLDGRTTSRGFNIASRLLGVRYDVGRYVCCSLRIKQTDMAYRHCGPADHRLIGFVYECEPQSADGTYKIGFSRNPAKRVAALSLKLRRPLRLLSDHLGTMLDEHALQCALRANRLPGEGEWFRRPSFSMEAA